MKYKKGDVVTLVNDAALFSENGLPEKFLGATITIYLCNATTGGRDFYEFIDDRGQEWMVLEKQIKGLNKITNWREEMKK